MASHEAAPAYIYRTTTLSKHGLLRTAVTWESPPTCWPGVALRDGAIARPRGGVGPEKCGGLPVSTDRCFGGVCRDGAPRVDEATALAEDTHRDEHSKLRVFAVYRSRLEHWGAESPWRFVADADNDSVPDHQKRAHGGMLVPTDTGDEEVFGVTPGSENRVPWSTVIFTVWPAWLKRRLELWEYDGTVEIDVSEAYSCLDSVAGALKQETDESAGLLEKAASYLSDAAFFSLEPEYAAACMSVLRAMVSHSETAESKGLSQFWAALPDGHRYTMMRVFYMQFMTADYADTSIDAGVIFNQLK
jgi:hypothetical protein